MERKSMDRIWEELEELHRAHWQEYRRWDILEIISQLANELAGLFSNELDQRCLCHMALQSRETDPRLRAAAKAGILYFTEPDEDNNYPARVAGVLAGIMAMSYSRYYLPIGFEGQYTACKEREGIR